MKVRFITAIFVLNALWIVPLYAAMSGGDFSITDDIFTVIEEGRVSGDTYILYHSSADYDTSSSSGGTYILDGGFFTSDEMTLELSKKTLTLTGVDIVLLSTDTVTTTITTDAITGYTLSITEDGDLRDDEDHALGDVIDGEVTIGDEEYGISTNGEDGLLSSDTAIEDELNVASNLGQVVDHATRITFKLAIGNLTKAASYSHIVTFSLTTNP